MKAASLSFVAGGAFIVGRKGAYASKHEQMATIDYSSLYDFTGENDGEYPYSTAILDANGNLYRTASSGGAYGYSVVCEITP